MKTAPAKTGNRLPGWQNPFDRFFRNDFLDLWNMDMPETVPSINIRNEDDHYAVEMAAPGLKKEDFSIDVDGNLLTIACEKESETKEGDGDKKFSRREYNYSRFSRSLTLPDNADAQTIKAKYIDGVLQLNIPKKAQDKSNKNQKINVE